MADFAFSPTKNAWLRRERGIGFEQIIARIHEGGLIRVLEHPNRERYPNQLIYEVDVDGYIYVVPAIWEDDTIFLKTVFPSRKATKRRMREE